MNTALAEAQPSPPEPEVRPRGRAFDVGFRIVALAAAVLVLVILAGILLSMIVQSWEWFRDTGLRAIYGTKWVAPSGPFEAGALIWGTVYTSLIALVFGVPVSIGIALYANEIAPPRLRRVLVTTIDLLAILPSVVIGLFVVLVLVTPLGQDIYQPISNALGSVPVLQWFFAGPAQGRGYLTAGLVLAVMIVPIVTSLSREVFATTPLILKEAALALGATRWEMIRGAIFPHSRRGLIAAIMVGLGRALGETIAVVLIVGGSVNLTTNLFQPGETLAARIARQWFEATGVQRSALIGLGVILFVVTFLINTAARRLAGSAFTGETR